MMDLEKVSEDARGWIYRLLKPDGKEVIFIFTRKGFWRGGEYHKSLQHDLLIFGSLHWLLADPVSKGVYPAQYHWKPLDQKARSQPEVGEIKAFQAHVVRADEDTFYCEWLEGDFEKTFVPEMRKLVEEKLQK